MEAGRRREFRPVHLVVLLSSERRARAPLWAHGIDFGHGTGHGVGFFLNVHEGPQTISKAQPEPHHAMEPGMITSDEPGVYRPGQWGVRIENLLLNVAVATPEDGALKLEYAGLARGEDPTIGTALDQFVRRHGEALEPQLREQVTPAVLVWPCQLSASQCWHPVQTRFAIRLGVRLWRSPAQEVACS